MTDVLVLCYHGISETWPANECVAPGDLERQLETLLGGGYRPTTISEALLSPPAERTLAVTFDDAHRSVLELALPVMRRLGVPGSVYVPTDYADSGGLMGWEGYDTWVGTEHEEELRCMTWEELGGLVEAGWEVGSHTCSHPRLSQLPDERLAAELSDSRGRCEERLGKPCLSFAYPYSDYDPRAVRAAAEAGYRSAVTVPTRPTAPLPFEWPRVGVFRGESSRRVQLRARSRRRVPSLVARGALALRRISR